jgi:hypothetical protein
MVIGVATAGMVFNLVFSRLSGSELKAYRPELEPFFMQSFRTAMQVGAWVAAIGIVVAFMRGKERR